MRSEGWRRPPAPPPPHPGTKGGRRPEERGIREAKGTRRGSGDQGTGDQEGQEIWDLETREQRGSGDSGIRDQGELGSGQDSPPPGTRRGRRPGIRRPGDKGAQRTRGPGTRGGWDQEKIHLPLPWDRDRTRDQEGQETRDQARLRTGREGWDQDKINLPFPRGRDKTSRAEAATPPSCLTT